jgi:hypothetical protein
MAQTFGQIEQERALEAIVWIAQTADLAEDAARTLEAAKALFLAGEYAEINEYREGSLSESSLWEYADCA